MFCAVVLCRDVPSVIVSLMCCRVHHSYAHAHPPVVATMQLPPLPDALSPALREVLVSMVRDLPLRRPTAARAWRRVAAMCFGPVTGADTSLEECCRWLEEETLLMSSVVAEEVRRPPCGAVRMERVVCERVFVRSCVSVCVRACVRVCGRL